MKINGNSYFLMIIMALTLMIVGSSLGMEAIKSKLLPIMIGSIVFILAAISLAREIQAKDKPEGKADKGETEGRGKGEKGIIGYLPITAWTVGFFACITLFGFIIAIPAFVLAYMKSHGLRWPISIISAALITPFIYVVFKLALRIDLYPGLVFTWFGS